MNRSIFFASSFLPQIVSQSILESAHYFVVQEQILIFDAAVLPRVPRSPANGRTYIGHQMAGNGASRWARQGWDKPFISVQDFVGYNKNSSHIYNNENNSSESSEISVDPILRMDATEVVHLPFTLPYL